MIGFVDVGGGTRGIFGAGVFDYCIDHGIECDYFIGVSAGAANGVSFIGGQRGRNYVYYNDYAFRKEYMSKRNFIKTGSYLGLDYIYRTLSNSDGEYPVDYQSFIKSKTDFFAVATDAITGSPIYFGKDTMKENDYGILCASCCVPVVCKPYEITGQMYFDGGISDPIPVQKAIDDGCDKIVIVLTKPKCEFRTPEKDIRLSKLLRKKYPKAAEALSNRADTYNNSLKTILRLEKEGSVLIVAPDDIGKLKTLSQDHVQLDMLYQMGYEKARLIESYLG